MPMWVGALFFTIFACMGYLSTRFAIWLTTRLEVAGDAPARSEPPLAVALALACGAGIVGTSYVSRDAPVFGIALLALVCFALGFACYADLRSGKIPAVVMLPILVLLAVVDIYHGAWLSIAAAAMVTAPFAAAAALSKSKNLGWSDVQVVVLGALVLDVSLGLMVLAAACFLTVAVAAVRSRLKEPVDFAPYLTSSIGLALLVPNALH